MSRRWGKAGQRLDLSPDEAYAATRARVAEKNRQEVLAQQSAEREEKRGHSEWAAGRLCPDRITLTLDAKGLEGPEVDAQCLAQEPEVDLWEAGELYPTWEQTKALAHLCGVTPRFLMQDSIAGHRIEAHETTLRFQAELPDPTPPVLAFTEQAIRERMNPRQAEVLTLHKDTLW